MGNAANENRRKSSATEVNKLIATERSSKSSDKSNSKNLNIQVSNTSSAATSPNFPLSSLNDTIGSNKSPPKTAPSSVVFSRGSMTSTTSEKRLSLKRSQTSSTSNLSTKSLQKIDEHEEFQEIYVKASLGNVPFVGSMPRSVNSSRNMTIGNGNTSPSSPPPPPQSAVPSSKLQVAVKDSANSNHSKNSNDSSDMARNTNTTGASNEFDGETYTGKIYSSVGVYKIDWSEISILTGTKKDIIGHGSYGMVVKAVWKPRGKLSLLSRLALEDEDTEDGVEVAIKIFTRPKSGDEFNISKVYQQACDEVNVIHSAEQRIFDTSCIVHPFGVAKGPLSNEMCQFFHLQNGEEGIGIIMRLEAGGSLGKLILPLKAANGQVAVAKPIPMLEKIRILSEIARGLSELHAAGIVHADIKTENVLLSHHKPCKVRLADFGLSIIREQSDISALGNSTLTMTTHLRGTPIYCAPELLTNPFQQHKDGEEYLIANASRKSDMYSFAILMWEVLVQKLPFPDIKTEIQLCTKVHQGHRPPISELPVDTPKSLITLMVECWDKDRNNRKSAVETAFLLQSLYYSAINQKPDIFFRNASIPKQFRSHIFFYFIRLGYYISSDDVIPRHTVDDVINQSKVVVVCMYQEFQNSDDCMDDLKNMKEKFPDKKIVTLILEEKLLAWVNKETRELCDFDIHNTVDISHLARAHWNREDGPNTAMLTALTKNLEPLKELIVEATGQPPPRGHLDALRNTTRLQGQSSAKAATKKSFPASKTAEILAGLELCVAVYEGDMRYIRSLLESGCPVNASCYDYRSAAHICCAENNIPAALLLYEYKADFISMKSKDRWGRTPLEEAEFQGYKHLVTILKNMIELDKIAYKQEQLQKAKEILHYPKKPAVEHEIIKVDCIGLELCVAAYENDTDYLCTLLISGCPVNTADYDLRTPAHISCSENNIDIIRILNDFKADFHSKKVKDRYGNTPLMEAERLGRKEIVVFIKTAMADREKRRIKAVQKAANDADKKQAVDNLQYFTTFGY